MTVRSTTGLLEIDEAEAKLLGVQTSFWIGVALTYLEFLGERDVSSSFDISFPALTRRIYRAILPL